MFRAVAHYYFKKGMEFDGIDFVKTHFMEESIKLGCHDLEVSKDANDSSHWVVTGIWDNLEKGKKFRSDVMKKGEEQLMSYCSKPMFRELFEIKETH